MKTFQTSKSLKLNFVVTFTFHLYHVHKQAHKQGGTLAWTSRLQNCSFLDAVLDRKYDIVEMNAIPTCLDFWAKLPSGDHSVLIWGDSAGDVYCLSLNVISKINMFVKEETREKPTRVSIDDFMNDRLGITSVVHSLLTSFCA